MSSELRPVRIRDASALTDHCALTGGALGALVASAFGLRDDRSERAAESLGIAMRLTCIARDVEDDARSGRRYLPASIVGELSAADLLADDPAVRIRVRQGILWTLTLADEHYRRAIPVLRTLSPRRRLALLVLARLHRDIGRALALRGFDPFGGRVVVPASRKLIILCRSLLEHVLKPAGDARYGGARTLPSRRRGARRMLPAS